MDGKNLHRNLFILIIILTLDLLSFTCILPLFPAIIDLYAKNAAEIRKNSINGTLNSIHISNQKVDFLYKFFESICKSFQIVLNVPDLQRYNNVFFGGILGSLFSFLQYLSSPILGALSDAYGRKPILILSIIGSFLSYYLWSISDTFTIFILSRIIGGLSKASVSVAISIVTDICPAEKRGQGMAFVGVAFSLAFLMGPMFGAYFATGARNSNITFANNLNSAPANFAMCITIFELCLSLLLLPETFTKPILKLREIIHFSKNYISPKSLFDFKALTSEENEKTNEESLQSKRNIERMRGYGYVYFLYLFLYSGLEFTLCFLTHIRFQYDSMQQGKLYLFTGIIMVVLQGSYVRRIAPNKQRQGALIGLGIIIPAYMVISVAYTPILLYFGLFLYAIASAIVVPCLTTLVSEHCIPAKKGTCMGVFRSIGALSRACGPIFGALLFWLAGPTLCYAIGSILLLIPFCILRRLDLQYKALALKVK